ncbi:ATP-dependent RecD-like DNA helicase [Baekduia soli]|uniref:ATP-dependent RecD2 DNA helicase n=1 Tax=Baekduia soli TaxID=496014 RepID=A0A5B8U7M7_9ACTN|nr:ATP-dependent RecD-like DNA helicase [Baekduia soli]QEC48941.1 ATP-dependent RecD-like DNA helicase [Baekduia soli]
MPEPTSLAAEIVAVRWRADDGGFAVLAALGDDGAELVLTGAIGHLHEGDTVEVDGTWRDHPRFGRQLHVQHARIGPPASDDALRALLASVTHVGPRGAEWLVERHGDQVLEIVDRDPGARLREVPGIGRARLRAAVASWQEQAGGRALRLVLSEHGVPEAVAARVMKALGGGALALLESEPYALARVEGIGFATADAVARALGTPADDPGRIDAGLHHALRAAEQDGHCFLGREELLARATRLLELPAPVVTARLPDAGLVLDGDRVIEPRMDRVERGLAERVLELAQAPPTLDVEVPEVPDPDQEHPPTPTQWRAVQAAAEHRLSILTGLPGTGKTATMRALVDLLRAQRRTVRLCAPTGKAARRLSETTGAEATTIHRLLEWSPGEGFLRDAGDPLTGVDLLVVDEASMLDVRLAAALLDAVGPRTHVLLVGDVDQLAPVGPGRVLEDLIASGVAPSTRLTEVFRQAARSLIIRAAHAIDRGEAPPTRAQPDDLRDFFLVQRDSAQAVFDEVVSLAVGRLPAHYDLDPVADLQVLVPMHRGPVGIDALNAELRERLNPDGRAVKGTAFRLGDRIMQTRNNHERAFYNGEIGVIVNDDPGRGTLTLVGDDGRRLTLDRNETGTLRLAYACSVHKMQGSQAPAIVIALARGHAPMLTRNLLYTAVTRSQTACVVVAEHGALEQALARVDASRRNTRLVGLLA